MSRLRQENKMERQAMSTDLAFLENEKFLAAEKLQAVENANPISSKCDGKSYRQGQQYYVIYKKIFRSPNVMK